MFEYHINSIRKGVHTLLNRPGRPPERVLIKMEHAEYLGVTWRSNPRQIVPQRASGLYVTGAAYGPIVSVLLMDLFLALENAEGVETKLGKAKHQAGQSQDPDPDHGATAEASEDGHGSGSDEPGPDDGDRVLDGSVSHG